MMGKCMYLRKGETHTAPISGILANTLAVGSTVKLMENNAAVEYLIVHQGLPSSMYDASCDGCWVLRKDVHSLRPWHLSYQSYSNYYQRSDINAWLNNDFFTSLGSVEQSIIKQVKIPYVEGGSSVQSGANGLPTKIFLLSCREVGQNTIDASDSFPFDGSCLSYFESGNGTSANNKRIANLNETATSWWIRSPVTSANTYVWYIGNSGSFSRDKVYNDHGVRPALILPSDALFEKDTLILKGVA